MKILPATDIKFGDKTRIIQSGKNKIEEVYNDDNILIKRLIRDEFSRDIDCKTFDSLGNILEHQHKDYFSKENEEGFIETFKSKYQE